LPPAASAAAAAAAAFDFDFSFVWFAYGRFERAATRSLARMNGLCGGEWQE